MKLLLGILGLALPLLGHAVQTPAQSKDVLTEAGRRELVVQAERGNGDAVSQRRLGILYEDGIGVKADHKEAIRWFRLAADQGDSEAQRRLANLYLAHESGTAAVADIWKYLQSAINQGNMTAMADGGLFNLYDFDAGNQDAAAEAVKYFTKSAEAGNDVGQMRLGRAYSLGLGVARDARLAQRWLSLAALQGNADAIFFLKRIYDIEVKQPLTEPAPPPPPAPAAP
jgi:hypothetical protein